MESHRDHGPGSLSSPTWCTGTSCTLPGRRVDDVDDCAKTADDAGFAYLCSRDSCATQTTVLG